MVDPEQGLQSAASDLGLLYLPVTFLGGGGGGGGFQTKMG